MPAAALHTTLLLAVLCGSALLLFGELGAELLLRLLKVPEEVLASAALYLRIYFLGLPVIALYNFESSIFRCVGDTRTPLVRLAFSGVVNVDLNLFFAVVLHRAVDGVAIATVVSNLICASMLLWLLCHRKDALRVERALLVLDRRCLGHILQVGLPASCQLMMVSFANVFVQTGVNSLGRDTMAGSAAAATIEVMGFYIVQAFGQACTTFVGQAYGAGDLKRARRATRICLAENAVAAVMDISFILSLCTPLLRLFNDDPAVIAVGRQRLWFVVCSWGFSVFIEVLSGAMRGYRYALIPAIMAMVGTCGLRIVWITTVFRVRGTFASLYAVYPVSLSVTAAAIVVAYLLLQRRLGGIQAQAKMTNQ
ncbi:MAG: MATE family efflux transporter [Clostridiales bacterium]|nr:MATE family efflux transporter [Clostridiales bacterium]